MTTANLPKNRETNFLKIEIVLKGVKAKRVARFESSAYGRKLEGLWMFDTY